MSRQGQVAQHAGACGCVHARTMCECCVCSCVFVCARSCVSCVRPKSPARAAERGSAYRRTAVGRRMSCASDFRRPSRRSRQSGSNAPDMYQGPAFVESASPVIFPRCSTRTRSPIVPTLSDFSQHLQHFAVLSRPLFDHFTVLKLDFGPEIGGNFASPLGGIWGPKAARRRRSPAISEPPATAAPRSRST